MSDTIRPRGAPRGEYGLGVAGLTVAGSGGEVISKAGRTLALIHARGVDTLSRLLTDTGVHQAFIDVWRQGTENDTDNAWQGLRYLSNT